MFAQPTAADEKLIPPKEYANKYCVHYTTVLKWVSRGRVNFERRGQYYYVEDVEPPFRTLPGGRVKGGKRLCAHCRQMRDIKTEYSPSRRVAGSCRFCSAHHERIAKGRLTAEGYISYDSELRAYRQIESHDKDQLAERERSIQAHTERIAAMGLAGDGEDWPDGN